MITFKNITDTLKNFIQSGWDEIYLGTDAPENKLLKRSEVVTEIGTNVPVKSSQVTNRGGVAEIDTLFLQKTGSEVTFINDGHYAGQFASNQPTKPRYHNFTVSKTNAINGAEATLEISALFIPQVLVSNKPDSPLPTYGSQGLMTADFANQTAGQYYYFTGSTTAWQYNGTATDSIDNYDPLLEKTGWKTSKLPEYDDQTAMITDQANQEAGQIYYYAGSDSGWRKGTTSTENISNYTENTTASKWQEWGNKPEWLIVEGDVFLVGLNNLNVLKFNYYRHERVNGVLYVDKVVCKIVSVPNGNYDANPEYPTLMKLTVDENADPVTPTSVVNTGTYADEFPITVAGLASEAFYELISGSNYAFAQGVNAGADQSSSIRARLESDIDNKAQRYFEAQKITIIVDFALVFGSAFSQRFFFSNENNTNLRGCSFGTGTGLATAGEFRLRIGRGSGWTTLVCPSFPLVEEDGKRHFIAVTWTPINGGLNGGSAKFYYKCSQNSIPFTYLGESTSTSNLQISNGNELISLSRNGTSSMDPEKRSYMEVIPDVLTQAQIEAIATVIHP